MMRRVAGVLALLMLVGCDDQNGTALGGCPTSLSWEWRTLNLGLAYQRPHNCPVLVGAQAVWLEAGGVVDATSEPSITRTLLAVQNRDAVVVGGAERFFQRTHDNRWIAEVYTGYNANTIPYQADAARFQLYRGEQQGPFGIMTITYTSQVSVNLLGPDVVMPGSPATWTAEVTAGRSPFRYEWYQDWERVGTGPSYTSPPASGHALDVRVDVYDADGHAASSTKQVPVHGCDPSMIRC